MKTALLIDTKFFCYRAVTTQYKLTHNEVVTGVHYNWFNSVKSIGRKFSPDNIIAMCDSRKSYRRDLYPLYKIKKKKDKIENENLILQLKSVTSEYEKLIKVLQKLGIVTYRRYGLEADDLFAMYINQFNNIYDKFIIATDDEDIHQLLQKDIVEIYNPRTKKMVTQNSFKKEHEFDVNLWAKYKAMRGCNSDKIPGLPGIGEKTANKFFKQSIKEIEKQEKELPSDYHLFLKLTTLPMIHDKFTLKYPLIHNQTELNVDEFITYCQDYGFKLFLKEIDKFMEVFKGQRI